MKNPFPKLAAFLQTEAAVYPRKNLLMKPAVAVILFLLFSLNSIAQADSVLQPVYQPLQVQSFAAKVVDKSVVLGWTVSGNEEAKGFEVERSEDGQTFRKIGGKLAAGSIGAARYEFVDALPKAHTRYTYRLRILGKDGASQVSDTQSATVEDERLQCRLKQNPVRQHLELEITTTTAAGVSATVLTAYGQPLSTQTAKVGAGSNTLLLPLNNLPAGLHRLLVESGGERKVLSFVKE